MLKKILGSLIAIAVSASILLTPTAAQADSVPTNPDDDCLYEPYGFFKPHDVD